MIHAGRWGLSARVRLAALVPPKYFMARFVCDVGGNLNGHQ
jgi:hypothetical protein